MTATERATGTAGQQIATVGEGHYVHANGTGGYTGVVQFTQGTYPGFTYTLDSTGITKLVSGSTVTVVRPSSLTS